jgi:hypothetical protein
MTLDEAIPAADVWPENVQAVKVFISMDTQWRVGTGGAIGLDYNALPAVLRMSRVPRTDWPDVFECIRVLEGAALKTMMEQRKNG